MKTRLKDQRSERQQEKTTKIETPIKQFENRKQTSREKVYTKPEAQNFDAQERCAQNQDRN